VAGTARPRRPLIGAHVSAAGGYESAVERARAIGAEAFQVWIDQPQRFPRAPLDERALRRLRRAVTDAALPGFVHVPYLVNLASSSSDLLERSIDMVARGLRAARLGGLRGAVLHVGSHHGRGYRATRLQVILALEEATRRARVRDRLVLENSVGAGGQIGADFSELRDLIEALSARRIIARVAIDFAHSHANGADLSHRAGVDDFAARLRRAQLADRVALVHANDSASPAGSRRDRHANPGEGEIGATGLRRLAGVTELARVPWILEVPGIERSGPTRREVARLRRIVTPRRGR
jgi:deoxyribonuclease-4